MKDLLTKIRVFFEWYKIHPETTIQKWAWIKTDIYGSLFTGKVLLSTSTWKNFQDKKAIWPDRDYYANETICIVYLQLNSQDGETWLCSRDDFDKLTSDAVQYATFEELVSAGDKISEVAREKFRQALKMARSSFFTE